MTPATRLIAAVTALVCSSGAWAENTLVGAGYTGLGITPNAHLLGWGQFAFTYDSQLPGAADPSGHNFVAGFGLLPNLEMTGRVAANTLNTNCFVEPCGLRDLSASVKAGIALDQRGRYRIAVGATDLGGAATNFRSYYGVLTYSADALEFSGGLARRGEGATNTTRSPLDGPFVSAAWQPLSWLRGHVEYVDRNAWAGVRLFAPAQWLPDGWSAFVGANARLNNSSVTHRSWFTAGLSIPLYKVPAMASHGATATLSPPVGVQQPPGATQPASAPQPAPVPQVTTPAQAQPPAVRREPRSDAALQELARQLQLRGLEDIWVGRMPDASIAIRANNATYNWNTVDALGAGLSAIAGVLGDERDAYRFVLTQRQIPIVAVTGQTDCLREWISLRQASCAAGELSTPGSMPLSLLHQGADWVVRALQPSWKTLRVAISPVLRTTLATEIGVLDYSAGVNVGFLQPLWSGASAEWRVQQEITHSDDFDRGRLLYSRRLRNGTERLVLTQTMRLPLERWVGNGDDLRTRNWGLAATTAQASIGRMGGHFDGVHAAIRTEPGDGRHRFTLQGALLRNQDYGSVPGEPRTARPLLLGYRYHVAPTRTYLEATGGQFMRNDLGLQLGLRQWFGDVSVQAYVRRSRFSGGSGLTSAGLEVSVPIGPRRDMNPSLIQVTGTPRFAHAIETKVGGTNNAIVSGVGVLPPAPSLDALHNSDRAGLLYFEDNIPRLRDAAR